MKKCVYLDHNSTTHVDPRVLEAMQPYFVEKFGNSASRYHRFGWEAKDAVDSARERCAAAINALPDEIVFTSGATEAINLALKGATCSRKCHVVTTASEHSAVLDTVRSFGANVDIEILPVDAKGAVDPARIESSLRSDTRLVSVMLANNEIGTINRVAEVGAICRDHGVLFHSDATQGVGRIPIDVRAMKIDLLAMSAHKFYGPKGVGACFIREGIEIDPQIHGGGHQRGLRAGTLNVPGIVGMARAMEIAIEELDRERQRLDGLCRRFHAKLAGELDLIRLNGPVAERLPGNLNYTFLHAEGEALLMSLPDLALSSGSACTSAKLLPSHVLKAIGLTQDEIHSSIRIGLGRGTTEEDVDYAALRIIEEVRRFRALSPRYEAEKRARPPAH